MNERTAHDGARGGRTITQTLITVPPAGRAGIYQPGPSATVQNAPFWDGVSIYPSVTVRLDFRGEDVGDLPYECTFLAPADNGLGGIRVLPNRSNAQ